jgi:hypothetical protein
MKIISSVIIYLLYCYRIDDEQYDKRSICVQYFLSNVWHNESR